MAHWTYFILAIVWAFSLEVESKCDTIHKLKNQEVKLFDSDNTLQPCVKVGECVIAWRKVTKNGLKVVEYEAQAETNGFIAVGLNNHGGNWRGADIAIVAGTTTDYHSLDCINAAEDIFKPLKDTDGQDLTVNRILQDVALRTVLFERPMFPSTSTDRTIEKGIFLLCAYGPQTNLDDPRQLTVADSASETASYQWNGSSALSASIIVLLLGTTMAAYLNIQ